MTIDFMGHKSHSPWCDEMRKESDWSKMIKKYAHGGHVRRDEEEEHHRHKKERHHREERREREEHKMHREHKRHHEHEMHEDRKMHAGRRMKDGGMCDSNHMKKGGLFSADIDKGGLHRALGVPSGKKIGMKKIEKAEHSGDAHMRRMAQWAENAIHARKKK